MAGGTCGLAWAAAMRAWMAQLAAGMPHSQSTVTWLTLTLVLLPGAVVGALLGRAAYRRAAGLPASRRLVAAPVVFASALLDPHIAAELIRNGTGGGSLIVVATALAIGYAMTRRRRSMKAASATVLGALGLLVIFGMGGLAGPLDTPHGAWVSALGCALVLLLGLAASLAHPPAHGPLSASATMALGTLIGFTWAAGLLGFLAQVAPDRGGTGTWSGTFGGMLLPGALGGAVIGWAALRRRVPATGGPVGRLPLPALALAALAAVMMGATTAESLSGFTLSHPTTRNVWLGVYLTSLLAVLAGGVALPPRTRLSIRPDVNAHREAIGVENGRKPGCRNKKKQPPAIA